MLRRLLPLASVLVLAACGGSEEAAAPEPQPAVTGTAPAPAAAPGRDDGADGGPRAILAALGGDYVNADLANGARQFRRCQSCHTLDAGGRHTVGPNLHGVIGRAAASAEGFDYSRQLEAAGLVWDLDTLDAWIENPRALVPGNRMSFVGLRDPQARRDVIGYLAVETAD